jgi:hypothetical protein
MSASKGGKQTRKRSPATNSPELNEVSRALASLALARMRQDGSLKVRQREQLRRALATAADAMGWVAMGGETPDRVKRATRDVTALADAGASALEGDLADEVAGKKSELEELERVTRSVQMLAMDAHASFPAEVEFSHTARHGTRHLVTKTETLTLSDADEAQNAVATLEKRMESWAKLRDQMLEELKDKQRQIQDMKATLASFVDASQGLVGEVLATRY